MEQVTQQQQHHNINWQLMHSCTVLNTYSRSRFVYLFMDECLCGLSISEVNVENVIQKLFSIIIAARYRFNQFNGNKKKLNPDGSADLIKI